MKWFAFWIAMVVAGSLPASASNEPTPRRATPDVIQVGPTRAIKTIATSAYSARAGAIIYVDSGTYTGDVAVWTQDNITVRATGGRVLLLAKGAAAESKAIWVVRAKGMQVEGFDFEGAATPDRNGAGIRFEKGSLLVRDCSFTGNENGLLASNDSQAELTIENSEFGYNGFGDGQSHNLYVGSIAKLTVSGSNFHHARVGHLLKSRAAVSYIVNTRLVDGNGGTASYELEFPNGGIATVVGNTIAQSTATENPILISFGAEGYKWPRNTINLENNTLVNPLGLRGVFLRVAPGADSIRAVNNRLVGAGRLEFSGHGEYKNNTHN
jgi:hypothetical protein